MHSAISNGTLMMSSGLTFGDNTSPSNCEPIARARQQLAQHLWINDPDFISKAAPYPPPFNFAQPATPAERASFTKALPDSINKGVLDAMGNRRPPTYDHHVDDNMYADITEFLPRAAFASIIALYEIVGYPNGKIPDPISWDKFETTHGHIRRVVGWDFNTRELTFTLPNDKRTALTDLLATWLTKAQCTLLEAATLHGTLLANASKAYRPGRALFFGFQNALRRAIQNRYHQVKGYYNRDKQTKILSAQLPKDLHTRLDNLIARDIAALLWRTKTKIDIPKPVSHELQQLHALLNNPTINWSISIGHVIPRDAQFTSLGDACGTGGGAFCHELKYWFDILWSPRVRKAFDTGTIHINLLEFAVVLIQLAAAITRSEEPIPIVAMPPLSKLLIRTDNSPSKNWAHKVSAKSERGQLLVSLYAAMLTRTELTVECNHVAGIDNNLADFISRPPELISHADRCQQIFQMEPRLKSYNFFRPNQELSSYLESRLFTEHWQESPPLPKLLGRFETVDCITSCSVII